ncbi:hypothetical protein [Alkalihalobacillus sp. LMS39]|uniref:hypothetical protein n=1 Tax=Alkalihalobacillus sp. LMS39 TaxID=2924032 RepID=UPI001FB3545E|nr:hypothetical protein [Alkalihalobacillus sp. LMS39]UOE92124.1 hypothetical protein MM271_12700 [Alkalihalobacillus sp. LMS39]
MKEKKENKPTIAPGINNDEELSKKATEEEIRQDEATRVITMSWDENPGETK